VEIDPPDGHPYRIPFYRMLEWQRQDEDDSSLDDLKRNLASFPSNPMTSSMMISIATSVDRRCRICARGLFTAQRMGRDLVPGAPTQDDQLSLNPLAINRWYSMGAE
jgi:hypothetical protein